MIPVYIAQCLGNVAAYDEKEFIVNGRTYRSLFCSDALRKHLAEEGENVRLVLFVPESLLVGESLDEVKEKLEEKLDIFELVAIPSVGEYVVKGSRLRFVSSVENISASIFLHFVKMRPEKLFVDVSTGFNVYPVSMLEAAKRYLTYRKLERILQGDCSAKVFAVFPPPVLKAIQTYHVEIQPVDVKAFFALPNANVDRIVSNTRQLSGELVNRLRDIGSNYSELKRRFRTVFRELRIGLNAIRLNVPLAFYEILEMGEEPEKIENEMVRFAEEFLNAVRADDVIENFPVDGVNVANVFYSIALYRSVRDFKESLDEPEVRKILEIFSEVYKNLGTHVNEYFLQRDVEEILARAEKLDNGESCFLGLLKYDSLRRSGNEKRNFFAHSGFLEEYTIVEKRDSGIYVKWDENKKKDFKKWLLSPA